MLSLSNYESEYPDTTAWVAVRTLRANQSANRAGMIGSLIFGIVMTLGILYSSPPKFVTKEIAIVISFLPLAAFFWAALCTFYELERKRPLEELQRDFPIIIREACPS